VAPSARDDLRPDGVLAVTLAGALARGPAGGGRRISARGASSLGGLRPLGELSEHHDREADEEDELHQSAEPGGQVRGTKQRVGDERADGQLTVDPGAPGRHVASPPDGEQQREG